MKVFNTQYNLTQQEEYLLYIIGWSKYSSKETYQQDWTNLMAEQFQLVIGGNYRNYINSLLQKGLIEVYNKEGFETYQINRYSKRYRLKDNSIKKGFNKTNFFSNNIYWKKWLQCLNNKTYQSERNQYIIDKTLEWFNTDMIHFDNKEKVQSIVNGYKSESYDKFNLAQNLVDRINSHNVTLVCDKDEARIYGNHSNLPKELRKNLQMGGNYLMEVDIKNSQLQILCLTLNEYFPDLYNTTDGNLFNKLVFENVDGLEIYEFIKEKYEDGIRSRSYIKGKIFHWLYSNNNNPNAKQIDDIFKTFFPNVRQCIYNLRNTKNGGEELSRQMRVKEADIILQIQYRLINKGFQVITIHDSFLFVENNEIVNYIQDSLLMSGLTKINITDYKVENRKLKVKEFYVGKRCKDLDIILEDSIYVNNIYNKEIQDKDIKDKSTRTEDNKYKNMDEFLEYHYKNKEKIMK